MTAFKQVLTNLQAGQREEAMIGLEFVLRLDPQFTPAASLKRQLASNSNEIDLGDIIAQLQAPTTEAINGLLIEAVDDFNSREFLGAKEKVEKVLIDLPGHQEARDLRDQIDKALKIEGQVGQFLIQAREALAKGDPQEAANFVMMAQALDPHHTGIASTLKEIDETGGLALSQEAAAERSGAPPEPTTPPPRTATTAAEPISVADTIDPDAPGPLPDDEISPPLEDAFAVEFDTQDPFADLMDSEPDSATPDSAPAPAFGDGHGDNVSFPPMDDTADLFSAPPGSFDTGDSGAASDGAASDGEGSGIADIKDGDEESTASSIQDLIERGQVAYDQRDQPQAISLWSRVFLLKPTHPEAGHLIERAKKSLAESETQIESLFSKARDAFDEGENDAARLLITKALALRPNHLEVNLLREQLDREQGVESSQPRAEEPPTRREEDLPKAAPELPELDDDLFGDLQAEVGADIPAEELDDDLFGESDDDFEGFEEDSLVDRIRSKISMRFLAIAGAALVVVLAGVWLGGKFLTAEPEEVDNSAAVNEVLVEADRLYKEHKIEEALHLLREFPAAGLSQQRIEMRIAKYEVILAPPTPTPVPEDASRAQALLDQGLWWSAYMAATDGLATYPDDPGLMEIQQLIIETEPEAPILHNALKTRDYRTAVSISEDLLLQYPGQGDLVVVLERSLFNSALAESRAYNLTGAENHLTRLLDLKPEDEEALRFIEFVQKYKVRAADMRLEIFIRSLNER